MNAYIEILKYGNRHDSIDFFQLFNHLTSKGIRFHADHEITERNSMLMNIFRTSFQDMDGNAPTEPLHKGSFFLKPDALAYLLNYEALELAKADSIQARQDALKASRQATVSIRIAIASIIVSIATTIASIVISLSDK